MVPTAYARRRRSPLVYGIGLLVVAAIAYGIYRAFFAAPPVPPAPPPPMVTVHRVEIRDIPLVFEYPARLAGSREVEIRARVGGIILKRTYTEGQFVKRGDLLFQIDPEPYQAALAQAQASYKQAESDWKRAQVLRKQKALSTREFDQAQGQYGAAKAVVDAARINLAYTTVRAPISGYTSEEVNSEGSLVTADQTLLTRVTQLDPMYVEFAYPDSEAMMQRKAVADGVISLPADKTLTVEILFRDGVTYGQEGKIRFMDSIISPDTGTVRARAIVPNSGQSILPGQFVRVRVKGMTQLNTVGIPERALMQGPEGTFVYTIDGEGNAVVTPVELGLLNQGIQLVKSGLKEGDTVITDGMIKVRPGQPVCVDTGDNAACAARQGDAPAPAAAPAEAEGAEDTATDDAPDAHAGATGQDEPASPEPEAGTKE